MRPVQGRTPSVALRPRPPPLPVPG
jgi:hypothetical protein